MSKGRYSSVECKGVDWQGDRAMWVVTNSRPIG